MINRVHRRHPMPPAGLRPMRCRRTPSPSLFAELIRRACAPRPRKICQAGRGAWPDAGLKRFEATKNGRNAIMALSADVRRVVTTLDSKDKAVVLLDGANPHKKVRPYAQTVSRVLWVTDGTPADLSGSADRAAIDIGIMPPRGGTVFRIVDFPPEPAEMRNLDPSTMHASLGDGAPKRGLP